MLYLLLVLFLVNSFLFGGVVGILLFTLLFVVCGKKIVTNKKDAVMVVFYLLSCCLSSYIIWAVCITVQAITEDLIFSKR